MEDINKKYESIIFSYFDELRGTFTFEQYFHIVLGATTIRWINMNNKYKASNERMSRFFDNEYGISIELQQELYGFENQFSEFDGILTGIMTNIFRYKDKSAEKKLQVIFQMINSLNFYSQDEIRKFINKLVSTGIVQCGFNETPESVKKIITGIMDFQKIRRFADYCAGASGVAIDIYENLRYFEMHKHVFYYGEEINTTNYLISKLLMIINEIDEYKIVNKDVLEYVDNYNENFDFIISDIPQIIYSDRNQNSNDPRLKYGIPTKSSADWAFAQNLVHHLNHNGKGVLLGTKGTLVRSNEADIRKGILNDKLIECVITLPDNLYEKTGIGTEMIIFNKNKTDDRMNKVLFINASNYTYRLNKNQHAITDEGINKILECYTYGFEEESFSKFVDLEKIKEYNYTLNPKEYLDFDALKDLFDKSVSLKDVAEIIKGVQVSKDDLEELSKQPDYYLINVKDIENGKINYDETSMLTYKKKDWIGKFDIRPNDIILTSKGSTVKIAIVGDDFKKAFISSNLTIIRVNTTKYDAYVLYEFLQSEVGARMIEGIQTGTTIKLLNNAQLGKIELPLYDINFMNEIGEEIKRNKSQYEKSLEEVKIRFQNNREEFKQRLNF